LPAEYRPESDNRWQQHRRLWPSSARQAPAGLQTEDEAAGAGFDIDLSQPIAGTCWYEAENSEGHWYRWTGPDPKFALDVLLPHQHSYRCEMVLSPVRPYVA